MDSQGEAAHSGIPLSFAGAALNNVTFMTGTAAVFYAIWCVAASRKEFSVAPREQSPLKRTFPRLQVHPAG